MPKHITSDQYIGNPHNLSAKGIIHPDIERHDHSGDTDRYLLPTLFAGEQGIVITAKYPGPGVFHITEGEWHVEDMAQPGHTTLLKPGSVFHVEEGSIIRWNTKSPTGAKGYLTY
ncbi:hypothetical protein JR316_0011239 [Psilocybe cubensis]|uniref:Uncharacterized protein n=2 Tax=Psilocybe cubensis TaxID=181762 RepID=A0A8H7XVV2_PSICU|nr:hypothetical protein JR316_0011239 [Psilocybe cubensis]KAH9475680.1 hypothetical protein JR316_0011239 [Psilocybe cubensis]